MQSGFSRRIPLSPPPPGTEQVLCHISAVDGHGILTAVHPCAVVLVRGSTAAPHARWQFPCTPIGACEGVDGQIYVLTEDGCVRRCMYGSSAPPGKKAKAKANDAEIGSIETERRVVPNVGRTSIVWQGHPCESRFILPVGKGELLVIGQPALGSLKVTVLTVSEGEELGRDEGREGEQTMMQVARELELNVGFDAPTRFAVLSRLSVGGSKKSGGTSSSTGKVMSLASEMFDVLFGPGSYDGSQVLVAAGGCSGKLWYMGLEEGGGRKGQVPIPRARCRVEHMTVLGSKQGVGGASWLCMAMADCTLTVLYTRGGGVGGASLHWTVLVLPGSSPLRAICSIKGMLACA
jgi:hypothetical protein